MRDLALGLRLAVGGGRMSGAALLRLAMTAFGIALAVAVLLPAAAVQHLTGAQAERKAAIAQVTEPRAGVAPLLTYNWYPSVGDDFVKVTAVAATGPGSPVPPGLTRLPAPGELAVSPELAAKLAAPGGGSLKAQLPGQVVEARSRGTAFPARVISPRSTGCRPRRSRPKAPGATRSTRSASRTPGSGCRRPCWPSSCRSRRCCCCRC